MMPALSKGSGQENQYQLKTTSIEDQNSMTVNFFPNKLKLKFNYVPNNSEDHQIKSTLNEMICIEPAKI